MNAPAPRIGFVSLGCAKALVDSERIITRLRAEGYAIAPSYDGADVVVVNTCGFLDSAKAESLDAIGEAMAENGRVVVTGCFGLAPAVRAAYPDVLAVTGPHDTEAVVAAINAIAPAPHAPFLDLVPRQGLRLTPPHYAYLKVSEGCNHACAFCIIPQLRGPLVSRPLGDVMREAEALAESGCRELLVVAQDTSAYGVDLRYAASEWRGQAVPARFAELCAALGSLGIWVRLHYVYPYRHVDDVIPLMAEGRLLPYLDVPFQHASPAVLRAMRRPAAAEKTLDRLARWRAICPQIAVRSTFVVGFPSETEADFETLLDWLREARLTRVGCFAYENVEGAPAQALPGHVPEAIKHERRARLMAVAAEISAEVLAARVGAELDVLVDGVDADGPFGRSYMDAPEIDGTVYIDAAPGALAAGDMVRVRVDEADAHDLYAAPIAAQAAAVPGAR